MAIKELTIYVAECDGCGAEITACAHGEPFWEEAELCDEALEQGWIFTPSEDLCRACRSELGDPPRTRPLSSPDEQQDEQQKESTR